MDIYTDIMYAKSIAINRSQRVFLEKNTGTYGDWRDGWHIYGCADVNSSLLSSCTNKSTDYKKVMPSDANTKVCSAGGTAMPSSIVFRPDGRVITPAGFTGITVSDNRNTASTTDDLIRTLLINFAGRVSIINQNGGTNSGVSC
jgi:Tfp pilus assembly protein FimT